MRPDRIVRVAIAAALLSSCCVLLAFQGWYTERSAGRRIGVDLQPAGGALVVSQLVPGLPAASAGLAAGDVLVAIGGEPIGSQADYERAARRFERGRPVIFTVRRQGRTLDVTVRPGAPARWGLLAMNGVNTLAYLAIALLALQRSRVSLQARLLFGFTAAVALEMAMPINALGSGLWIPAVAAFYLLTGIQMALELHLATIIPERPAWLAARRFVVPGYYAVGLGLGTASCATFLLESNGFDVLPWTSTQADLVVLRWGLPVWAAAVAVLLASQALRHPEPRGRHQAGLVLAATIPWLLFTVGTNLADKLGYALPVWTPALEGLILLAYPAAFFAAIFLYDLFDIELVVRRGLLYTMLTGTLVLLSYAALGAGGLLFSNLVEGRPSLWAVSAATLLLGLLFSPLRRWVQRTIDRKFFPERHAMRQRLIALAGELPALGKLPRMGRHLVSRLEQIFGARTSMLLIADPEMRLLSVLATTNDGDATGGRPRPLLLALDDPGVDHLRRAGRPLPASQVIERSPTLSSRLNDVDPAGLAVPLVHQGQLSGILVVGSKTGGDPFPTEEQELLNLVAHHVATVFENARLFESATYESLTGLLRREAILEQLEREIDRGIRYERPLAVAMADLDHFREVNERYGHLGGDTLLKRIAVVLSHGLRSTDWIGRYGGEEFLLVLPETDMEGASAVAEKVRRLVQATSVAMEDGERARVTISIGLATLAPVAAAHPGAVAPRHLIAAADRSLYEAKHAGRNQVFPKVA